MERQALELVNLTYQEAEKLTPLVARKFITLTINGAKPALLRQRWTNPPGGAKYHQQCHQIYP
jgi:hypothetical protein